MKFHPASLALILLLSRLPSSVNGFATTFTSHRVNGNGNAACTSIWHRGTTASAPVHVLHAGGLVNQNLIYDEDMNALTAKVERLRFFAVEAKRLAVAAEVEVDVLQKLVEDTAMELKEQQRILKESGDIWAIGKNKFTESLAGFSGALQNKDNFEPQQQRNDQNRQPVQRSKFEALTDALQNKDIEGFKNVLQNKNVRQEFDDEGTRQQAAQNQFESQFETDKIKQQVKKNKFDARIAEYTNPQQRAYEIKQQTSERVEDLLLKVAKLKVELTRAECKLIEERETATEMRERLSYAEDRLKSEKKRLNKGANALQTMVALEKSSLAQVERNFEQEQERLSQKSTELNQKIEQDSAKLYQVEGRLGREQAQYVQSRNDIERAIQDKEQKLSYTARSLQAEKDSKDSYLDALSSGTKNQPNSGPGMPSYLDSFSGGRNNQQDFDQAPSTSSNVGTRNVGNNNQRDNGGPRQAQSTQFNAGANTGMRRDEQRGTNNNERRDERRGVNNGERRDERRGVNNNERRDERRGTNRDRSDKKTSGLFSLGNMGGAQRKANFNNLPSGNGDQYNSGNGDQYNSGNVNQPRTGIASYLDSFMGGRNSQRDSPLDGLKTDDVGSNSGAARGTNGYNKYAPIAPLKSPVPTSDNRTRTGAQRGRNASNQYTMNPNIGSNGGAQRGGPNPNQYEPIITEGTFNTDTQRDTQRGNKNQYQPRLGDMMPNIGDTQKNAQRGNNASNQYTPRLANMNPNIGSNGGAQRGAPNPNQYEPIVTEGTFNTDTQRRVQMGAQMDTQRGAQMDTQRGAQRGTPSYNKYAPVAPKMTGVRVAPNSRAGNGANNYNKYDKSYVNNLSPGNMTPPVSPNSGSGIASYLDSVKKSPLDGLRTDTIGSNNGAERGTNGYNKYAPLAPVPTAGSGLNVGEQRSATAYDEFNMSIEGGEQRGVNDYNSGDADSDRGEQRGTNIFNKWMKPDDKKF